MYIKDFSLFSFKNKPITTIVYILMLVLSLLTTIYVEGHTPSQPGTRLYFSLPLTFFFCLLIFRKIIPCHEGGYALKVFYAVCVVRYVFLPYFTCKVGKFASGWSYDAFVYAIIIQDIELIVSFGAIRYYYQKQYVKISSKLGNKKNGILRRFDYGRLVGHFCCITSHSH